MAKKRLRMHELHQLINKIKEVHKYGHYASIKFSNYGHAISVYIQRNGFGTGKDFDFTSDFDLVENDTNIESYEKTMEFLDSIIEESKPKEMTLEEIEAQLGFKVKIVEVKTCTDTSASSVMHI